MTPSITGNTEMLAEGGHVRQVEAINRCCALMEEGVWTAAWCLNGLGGVLQNGGDVAYTNVCLVKNRVHDRDFDSKGRECSAQGRDNSAHDRDNSAQGRDNSAHDRESSAQGRDMSAHDRECSAHDRDMSAHDRESSAHDRDNSAYARDNSARVRECSARVRESMCFGNRMGEGRHKNLLKPIISISYKPLNF